MSKPNRSVNFSRRLLTCLGCVLITAGTLPAVSFTRPRPMQSNDGTPDATFGTAGVVRTDFSGHFEFLRGLAIQPDGKIVAVAGSNDPAGALLLVRYNRDGSLDASFGSGGKVFSKAGQFQGPNALALLPDGKILVAGSARGVGTDFAVARFNGDGSLDSSFGDGGAVVKNFSGADIADDVEVQPDGKILVAGFAGRGNLQASSFGLLRLKSQGSVDNSFGNSGKASAEFSGGFDEPFAMTIQPDGKIILAGGTDANRESPWGLARFDSDGHLDPGFGNGGKVTTSFSDLQGEAHAVAVQPDGKIVVAGMTRQEDKPDILAIARYQSDGRLDTTFGTGGKATYDFGGRGGFGMALALQRDGKILVAGAVGNLNANLPNVDFAVVRYDKDGGFDGSFGSGGVVISDLGDEIDQADAMAVQPDGKIVLGGYSGNEFENRGDIVMARYNNDSLAFDSCIQDDSNGNLLRFNTATGDYQFTACAAGLTLSGKGTLKLKGCKTKLLAAAGDHTLEVTIKTCKGNASATVEVKATGQTFTITDSRTADNSCACQ